MARSNSKRFLFANCLAQAIMFVKFGGLRFMALFRVRVRVRAINRKC